MPTIKNNTSKLKIINSMKLLLALLPIILCFMSCVDSYSKKNIATKNKPTSGESLFIEHCSQCHHKSMEIEMTGPALNKSIQQRNRNWIKQYILKGSEKSRLEGDSTALILAKQGWGLMPSFEFLSTKEIDDLLTYINTVIKEK